MFKQRAQHVREARQILLEGSSVSRVNTEASGPRTGDAQ